MERFGHRGNYNNLSIFENTEKAFLSCIKSEFNGIEADLRLLNDGNIVVFHDTNLLRVFKKDIKIVDKTFEELKELTNDNIILLQDLLKIVKEYNLKVILDIKDNDYLILSSIKTFANMYNINFKDISVILWNNKKLIEKDFKTF